jgi:hypothetical protein
MLCVPFLESLKEDVKVPRSLTKGAVGLLMQMNSYEMISFLEVLADEM